MKKNVKEKFNCLKKRNGEASATIMDEEGDSFKCAFNNDDCVTIDTEGMGYIVLTPENLELLSNLIFEAKIYYDNYFKREKLNDNVGLN